MVFMMLLMWLYQSKLMKCRIAKLRLSCFT